MPKTEVAIRASGLLTLNRDSFFRLEPTWKPQPPVAPEVGEFRIGDLLKFAGAA